MAKRQEELAETLEELTEALASLHLGVQPLPHYLFPICVGIWERKQTFVE